MGGYSNPGFGPRAPLPTPQEEADQFNTDEWLDSFFGQQQRQQQATDFQRQWGGPPTPTPIPTPVAAPPGVVPPVATPTPEPPPPSRGPALKDRDPGDEEGHLSGRQAFFRAAAARGGASAPREANPTDESIEEKLGFHWGKDVKINPATGRPLEDTGPLTGLEAGARNVVTSLPRANEDEDTGGYVMAGGDRTGIPYMPPSAVQEADDLVRTLTAQRGAERLRTGVGAAPATAGELLEDQRKNARTNELDADRDAKMAEAEALRAAGRYSQERYDQAIAQIRREHAMATSVDPRYFNY